MPGSTAGRNHHLHVEQENDARMASCREDQITECIRPEYGGLLVVE
jgi:hypothetical protein